MLARFPIEHRRLAAERDGWPAAYSHDAMLGLPAQPIAHAHLVLHPSENCFFLEPKGIESLIGKPHVMVGGPEPENAILMRDGGHRQRADLLDRHARIGMHTAMRRVRHAPLVGPWRIDNDDAIRALARERRWLAADGL